MTATPRPTPLALRGTRLQAAARAAALVSVTAALLGALPGCVAVVGGAAVGGALMLSDRRSSGAQIEDQSIELKAGGKIKGAIGERGHINVTSYNRIVLVTGEVPTEADRTAVIEALRTIENVGNVDDELLVGPSSTMSTRSSDTYITSKVKGALVDAKDLQSNAIKVVTERGNVYLMGRVTEREATRATEIARSTSGVMKVVRVFEILSEAELADLQNK
jgi:osmotically-inducible protein OsmY